MTARSATALLALVALFAGELPVAACAHAGDCIASLLQLGAAAEHERLASLAGPIMRLFEAPPPLPSTQPWPSFPPLPAG